MTIDLPIFDKQGKRIDLAEYTRLMVSEDYFRVAVKTLPDGKLVSTVWLGIEHSHHWLDNPATAGPTAIFETMVFASETYGDSLSCSRYGTLEEAQIGHEATVREWLSRIGPLH